MGRKNKPVGEGNPSVSLFFELEAIDKYMKTCGYMSEEDMGKVREVQEQIRKNVELLETLEKERKNEDRIQDQGIARMPNLTAGTGLD
jgi:hypothetical protein